MKLLRPSFLPALLAACVLSSFAPGQAAPTRNISILTPLELRGQTEPVARVEITAAVRGILAEINVKEGQTIKKGETLAKLDDALQKQKVEFERVSAESTAEMQYAQNQLDFAKHELDMFNRLNQASPAEREQKELAAKQALLSLEAAKDKQAQAQARYKEELITLERMTFASPIDGSVLRVNKQVGEQTDENPVLVVVQITRLNAVFYPPKELFGKIAVGDKLPLSFEGVSREGTVKAVDPIIDPASQIFRIKVEVDNADGKIPAGINATTSFAKQ